MAITHISNNETLGYMDNEITSGQIQYKDAALLV